jgi:hypothetical protein
MNLNKEPLLTREEEKTTPIISTLHYVNLCILTLSGVCFLFFLIITSVFFLTLSLGGGEINDVEYGTLVLWSSYWMARLFVIMLCCSCVFLTSSDGLKLRLNLMECCCGFNFMRAIKRECSSSENWCAIAYIIIIIFVFYLTNYIPH